MTEPDHTAAQELMFTDSVLAGYLLRGVLYLLMPAALLLVLKRYRAARIFPVIVGAAAYFLAVRFSDLAAHVVGYSQPVTVRAVLAAETVCYFEEAARWLAMRYPVTDIRDVRAALCYGIGHGGLECWIRGAQMLKIWQCGRQRNSGELSAAAAEKLAGFADHPLALSLMDAAESAVIFGVQIALTLFLFRRMQESNFAKRWLLAAMGLHLCVNGAGWLSSFSGDPCLCDFVGITVGLAVIVFVCRCIPLRRCADEIRGLCNYDENL